MMSRIALMAAMVLLAVGGGLAEDRKVHVYNWTDYIDKAVLVDFTAETGIEVVYDVFDSNRTLEARLLAGNTGYDVVVPSGDFLARQIEAGLFRPLDKSRLSNLRHMDEAIAARVRQWDPGNRYAVTYLWGTTGIGFNEAKVAARNPGAPTGSWRMLFDPAVVSKFADCGVYLLDEPGEVIPAVLNHLGLEPASHDVAVIARAEPVLRAIRPYIRGFHNTAQMDGLAAGSLCLAMGWSGDMLQARERAGAAGEATRISYAIPDEGAQMWFDMMAIPADAPNADNAHRFLDYLMRPEVIAKVSNHVFYANGNAAATPHLDRELLEDPGIYPPPAVRKKLYVTQPYPADAQGFVTSLWSRIKGGR